ncbi:conserved hypothetical protein [Segniliparus rotundus DSM 44985]|uniref:DUF5130 domain-containing protein n=1 Tax=Segniliparus rotundus (strain ATCC BAA-972 / CDC 1076 / CIP 108378 / DSM 44985 / JCM 13578) TaxID=640132 RepID=D6Z7C3_SEGRD|nr:DUF5130 family protein [Segniliparus rotundus]ADG97853.1 conserved hypothetical protein [Segniliparus rotundus DSM 44985]
MSGDLVAHHERVPVVSTALDPKEPLTNLPFDIDQRVAVDEALIRATRDTGVQFSVRIGDLGADALAGAKQVFPHVPEAERGVLIAISPNERTVAVVAGTAVRRATEPVLQLGVSAATSVLAGASGKAKDSALVDAAIAAIRVIASAIEPV